MYILGVFCLWIFHVYTGRAGRVSEGHCFRMISSSMYSQLFDYCSAEMLVSTNTRIVGVYENIETFSRI